MHRIACDAPGILIKVFFEKLRCFLRISGIHKCTGTIGPLLRTDAHSLVWAIWVRSQICEAFFGGASMIAQGFSGSRAPISCSRKVGVYCETRSKFAAASAF